jgi:hypothetical protein
MGVRTCSVSCTDHQGCEHTVEVTADSLYEAVAQGLRVFLENDWVDDISRGQTISVVVRQPEIEHRVHLRDFEGWLESQGRSPAELSLKNRLRELLKSEGAPPRSWAAGKGVRQRER